MAWGNRGRPATRRTLNSQEGAKWPEGTECPGGHRKKKYTQVARKTSSSQEKAEEPGEENGKASNLELPGRHQVAWRAATSWGRTPRSGQDTLQ